jgi:hypothetical protein
MIRRLFIIPVSALCLITGFASPTFAQDLAQVPQLTYPPAPDPAPDHIIVPPQENIYFPMRADGQAFVSNEDLTNNWTDSFNRFYFNPVLRNMDWAPYQNWWIPERACRLMSTWNEYDNFSTVRFLKPTNRIHKWFERYSGYGP